jgi:hypothetical protein
MPKPTKAAPRKPKLTTKPDLPLPDKKEPGVITSFMNLVDLAQDVAEVEKQERKPK